MAADDRSGRHRQRVVLARGELDKLEGPKYAARRAELRRKPKGGRSRESKRERQAAAASQDERRGGRRDRGRSDKRENDESGTTHREVGMKVAAR